MLTVTINLQEGTTQTDVLHSVAALEDGSVVAAGYAGGTWEGDASAGSNDFGAVKLASNGTVLWRWHVSR